MRLAAARRKLGGRRGSETMSEELEHKSGKFAGADTPPQLTVRALQSAEINATWMTWKQCEAGKPVQFERKDGYLMCLQRLDVPANPHWVDGRTVVMPDLFRGQSLLADLNQQQTGVVHTAVDCISFYASRSAIDRFQEEHGLPKVGALRALPGVALDDEVIKNLGECLLPVFQRDVSSQLFVDYVALALLTHLITRYGERHVVQRPAKGGLAPWQERRAKEMLLAHIDGRIGLDGLAQACGLSRSHFARAFKASTGTSPLQWLSVQRIDRAKSLLLSSKLTIDQIAHRCGFADQSHFTRAFLRAVSATPGAWRRAHRV
jgi:AraC family transcriptional regulator